MNKNKLPIFEILVLIIGEIIVSGAVCLVYYLLGKFSYKVALGTVLGSCVTVFNFLLLAITAVRAFDSALEARGEGELTDEQIQAFTEENKLSIQNKMKISYLVRNILMILALVVAFLVKHFDVIATLIPLVSFRIIMIFGGLLKGGRRE